MDKFGNELQSDLDRSREVKAAEINAGIRQAEDDFDRGVPTVLPGKLGQMQRNQQQADKAELRTRIRRGEKGGKAVQDLLKRKQQKFDRLPESSKRIQGLLD